MSNSIPSLIPNVVIIGKVNAGKSSLINAILNQDISVVSDEKGTTTDEVIKRMEILNIGPVNFIDTPGLSDHSSLGKKRLEKTKRSIRKSNLILFVCDALEDPDLSFYKTLKEDKILVFNKIDLATEKRLEYLSQTYPDAIFVSSRDDKSINELIYVISGKLKVEEKGLLEGINLAYPKIVLVIPIDSEAPKGRLILPQVQLLRECLDLHLVSIVLQPEQLKDYLDNNNDIGLIVCDSQVFKQVSDINKHRFYLTSFSILQARTKVDIDILLDGLKAFDSKIENVLIMESCSHNTSHEDIGQVKIPRMLKELIKDDFNYDFKMSYDFSEDISNYDLIVHCGSCMINADIMRKRTDKAMSNNVYITNYGILIAYYSGILDEAIQIFDKA